MEIVCNEKKVMYLLAQLITIRRRLLLWCIVAIFLLCICVTLMVAFVGRSALLRQQAQPPQALSEEQATAAEEETLDIAASRVAPAVVFIKVLCDRDIVGCDAVGSGFAIDEKGTIATNYHTIAEAEEITVYTADGSGHKATVMQVDEKLDIAIISIAARTSPPPFGSALRLVAGQEVAFITRLEGDETIVSGRVMNENSYREGQWFILASASAVSGHSGSPLFNMRGEVVGMVTYSFFLRGELRGSASVYIKDVLHVAGR